MMFVALGAVELKVNKMLLFLAEGGCCCSSPLASTAATGHCEGAGGLGTGRGGGRATCGGARPKGG